MVFQDYELVPTNRVSRQRHNTNLYFRRTFNAMGGYSTVYLMGISYFAGRSVGISSGVSLQKPLLNATGVRSLLKTGLILAGPTLFGL